jgi:capsular polysaccharide biosynthesis protein
VKDPDQTTTWQQLPGGDFHDRLTIYDGDAGFDDRSSAAGTAPGLVSLGFIGSALRRRARLWGILAIIGLIIGAGYATAKPPKYTATTTILLVDNPQENPVNEIATDLALAESTPVAAAVVSRLGLQETPASFLGTYSVTQVTTQILSITVSGPSSGTAVQRASAIATQYLAYRAKYAQASQQETEAELQQQVSNEQQSLTSITSQLGQAQSQPSSTSQQAEVKSLQAQQTAATYNLNSVKQYVTTTLASTRTTTQQMVKGSQVVSPATPGKRSVTKTLALYAIGGLLGGLAIGMVIVIIGAITSDRLRRRDDIAYAFGAPVRLSVGPLRSRRVPDLRGRAAVRERDMERVVEHLRNAVPGRSKSPVGLAVIAVDDALTVAQAVVALAISSSKHRVRIVLADLTPGALAARQLGVSSPGITTVTPAGVPVLVTVPAAEEIAPVGPLRAGSASAGRAQVSERLADACATADLILSFVALSPAFGGDHLATWATDAVAVVTAGQSTATRIRAVGEMIRIAGTRLDSVVVVDADRSDESLGALSGQH